jgi:hypothetical protein
MLEEFMLDMARSDHIWSQSDCAMTIANWWLFVHGVDPAADLRGTYQTEQECTALVAREGGMLLVVGVRARNVGAQPTLAPVPGDIGVIAVHGVEFGAILGPTGRWAVKSQHGVAGYRCSPLQAWSI